MCAEDEPVRGLGRRVGLGRLEPRVLHADVVGRDVQDQPDVAFAGGAPQRDQGLVATEVLRDVVVVDGVVAVVRERPEDGVEVDGIDAKVGQVIEVRLDALEIAAEELDHGARAGSGQLVPRPATRGMATVGPGAVRWVVRGSPFAKRSGKI